jgi:uncharacterized protein YdiU (UPF0061 family)
MKKIKLTTPYLSLSDYFHSIVKTTPLANPKLISYNQKLLDKLNISVDTNLTNMINGQYIPNGAQYFALAYAGHQFGYFVPQLGDGRAINLGKIDDYHLQLKGAGTTPYSRNGDGRAVLRSSIREYLLSEAMHGLNIPTTRAIGIINSTSTAYRQITEPCSIVLRASSSWIRFGTFEYAYVNKDNNINTLKELANFAIEESYQELKDIDNKYEEFYFQVVDKTIDLMVHWQSVGFMHGVMNTDNMSIAGLTIDYGPFAFMEEFKRDFVCNKSDHDARYSFENQPFIAQWNLGVLAQVLSPIANIETMNAYNDQFIGRFKAKYFQKMSQKFGIEYSSNNTKFIIDTINMLENNQIDYTSFFYYLTTQRYDDIVNMSLYKDEVSTFINNYQNKINTENNKINIENMKTINPKYILKNYILEEIISKCENGDFKMLNDFLIIAQNPFDEHMEYDKYSQATPKDLVGFTLSCSS